MEKYLRLLNPKTTNFEAIPSGGHGALSTADVCVAVSYAKLTKLQEYLFNLCALSDNSLEQIKVTTKLIQIELQTNEFAEHSEDVEISIFIALVELSKVPGSYKPSVRNRAIIGGVSKDKVQRKLNLLISKFREIFEGELVNVSNKIEYQINK